MKLAIIDHQHIFREGLQRLIATEEDLDIIVSTEYISDLTEAQVKQIDYFLIDIDVIEQEQALLNRLILTKYTDKKIIALASEANKVKVKEAVVNGCQGFLLKEMSYPKFIDAIRMIANEGGFIHPNALHHLLEDYRALAKGSNGLARKTDITPSRVCTNRENEILQLLVNGNDNSSIAKRLAISEKTVKNHLTNIFRKLNVKDRTQAAVLAIRNQWVEF